MTAEEFYKDHFGHTSQHVSMDKIFVCMELYAIHELANGNFNSGAIVETEIGTYADKNSEITEEYVMWNHDLSEVVNNLIENGLEINSLNAVSYTHLTLPTKRIV